jgi:hypothetical protein
MVAQFVCARNDTQCLPHVAAKCHQSSDQSVRYLGDIVGFQLSLSRVSFARHQGLPRSRKRGL